MTFFHLHNLFHFLYAFCLHIVASHEGPWHNSQPRNFSSHSSCLLKDTCFWTPFPTFSIMSSSHIFSVQWKPSYIITARQNILFQTIKKRKPSFFAVTVRLLLGTCSYVFSTEVKNNFTFSLWYNFALRKELTSLSIGKPVPERCSCSPSATKPIYVSYLGI